MVSFVRDSFNAAAVRTYLHEMIRGRKSATPSKSQKTSQKVSGVGTRLADKVAATLYSSSEDSPKAQLMAKVSAPRLSGFSHHTDTTTTASDSSTKATGTPHPRSDYQDQTHTSHLAVVRQAAGDLDGRGSFHITDTTHDSIMLKRAPTSATDSGYVSKMDSQADSKGRKMRRMYKQITAKCKKIWRKGPDVIPHKHCEEYNKIDNNTNRYYADSSTFEHSTCSKPAASYQPHGTPDILAGGYDSLAAPQQEVIEVSVNLNSDISEGRALGIDTDNESSVSSDSGVEDDCNVEDDCGDEELQADTESDTEDEDWVQGPRCDFKTINATPDELFEELARSVCDTDEAIDEIRVVRRTQGMYNFAVIIAVSHGKKTEHYVVRIPGHATLAHWTPEDAYMMEREVQLIEHIRKNTSAPVPKILHYSTEHTSSVGFPYIFMTELPGKPACTIWYDGDYENDDVELCIQHADIPSIATEKKRVNFLRSLARAMTDIQSLAFDKAGMPIIPELGGTTTVGPIYHWHSPSSDKARKFLPIFSTNGYAYQGLGRQQCNLVLVKGPDNVTVRGAIKCFGILFDHSVFKPAQPETFTIQHADLDLQNILVDNEGNVTGIIDWDGAHAAPRCVGTAAAPFFLRKDWLPDYVNNLGTGPHMGWKTHSYREIYAATLLEAGNSDAMYTMNSAIYQAAFMAVRDTGGCMSDFMDKMLREIPHCRVKANDFLSSMGLGWQDAENMLKVEFAKILEPQLPRSNLLAELDADIAMKEWYSSFDDFLAEDEEEEADSDSEDENETASDSDNE
jgi:aminoglycoside phosphotransferase (APT) family kinase protein